MPATHIFHKLVFSALVPEESIIELLCFSVWFIWRACCSSRIEWFLCSGWALDWVWGRAYHIMWGGCWRHIECSHGTWVKFGLFLFWVKQALSRFSPLLYFRSSRSPSSHIWIVGFFHGGWDEEAEEIKECKDNSRFSAFSARCISPNWRFESRAQSNVTGAGFRRRYVFTEMRILLVALHVGSWIPLFLF